LVYGTGEATVNAAVRPYMLPGMSKSFTRALRCAALLVLAAAPAQAQTLRLVYQGSVGDAPVLSAAVQSTTAHHGQGRYAMAADISLLGALAEMFAFRLQAEATGMAGVGVAPERYSSETTIFGEMAQVTLDYGADGSVALAAVPPTVEGRDAVARGLAHGTLDPLSAIAAVVNHVARSAGCGGTLAIFDGTRRYDLVVSQVGNAQVTRLHRSLYEGPAIECRVVPTLQAGFRPQEAAAGIYPREVSVWLASVVAGTPPVPVRILARSSLGTLLVDLVEASAVE
jgi:hypothetical protein